MASKNVSNIAYIQEVKKQRTMETTEKDNQRAFTPREYQIEILEKAKQGNTIACLGTGTGKTFIAVLLIREMAREAQIPFRQGGKKIFFLVPTVPLVEQQAVVLEKHTTLKIGKYFGEMGVDTWSKDDWEAQFVEMEVLVMTAEIGRIIFHHCFISVDRVGLLIFDECHRALGKNSPYREIMKAIVTAKCEKPRIFGLSASLINGKCKPSSLGKKLSQLEKTLTSVIVAATDYVEVQKYGTDPDEVIVMYNNEPLEPPRYQSILMRLDAIEKEIHDLSAITENPDHEISFFKKPARCVSQLKKILTMLGPWFAVCAARIYCVEIKKLIERMEQSKKKDTLYALMLFFRECISVWQVSTAFNLQEIPQKLQKLLEIFEAIKKLHDSQTLKIENRSRNVLTKCKDPLCIMFVEERIIAYVLCRWICEVVCIKPEYSFMKADFIVGHGTSGGVMESKESSMNVKQQQKVVKRFRNGDFNVLVATSVVEEGMDIQQCNVVIRFDMPKEFRSYVQSKGRARAAYSKYVMMLSTEDFPAFVDDICCYKTIENYLWKSCRDRSEQDEEDIQSSMRDDLIPPYQPKTAAGSPRITLSSSVGLLNRYCAKLPSDMATKLTVRWKVDVVDPDVSKKEYICTLRLPINSQLREHVTGQKMPGKKLAKMAAALRACKLLHEIGELDDNLLPFCNDVDNALLDMGLGEIETSGDGTQPGTNRRRQLYKKKVADILQVPISTERKFYLSVIMMDLVVPLPKSLNPRGRPVVNPATNPQGFGILTSSAMPKLPKFPIFTKNGKIQIHLKCNRNLIYLSDTQMRNLKWFHKFLFSDSLGLQADGMSFDPEHSDFSCLVVPVHNDERLDWSFIKYTLKHSFHDKKTPSQTVKHTNYDIELFKDAVVAKTYQMNMRPTEKPVYFYVNKICRNMSVKDSFDNNKFPSYKEFYKAKYRIDIKSDDQPLLDVERCLSYNLTKPLYTSVRSVHDYESKELSKSKQRHANFKEHLVPELCVIHPFSSALYRKASYLPCALYRINQLLVAESLRASVAVGRKETSVSKTPAPEWPVFNLETSDKELIALLISKGEISAKNYERPAIAFDITKDKSGEIVSFDAKTKNAIGPSPSQLLQALTTKSAGDEFDLERLETIGDSFLKYAITLKLYVAYPKFDEGKLTELRSRLIRNLNLYQLAKKKKLTECLMHTSFDSKHSWMPPCYKIKEDVIVKMDYKENSNQKNAKPVLKAYKVSTSGEVAVEPTQFLYTYQMVSDKCVADAMEALIGIYLLSCGHEGALNFMTWLGLDPYSQQVNSPPSVQSWPPTKGCISSSVENPSKLWQNEIDFERFEQRIGYTFKDKKYLLQAFTHPSYYYNEITDCFQRLEFLGDSILDYLITRKLYDDPKEHSPGKLTDLRAALVNNGYFASLAVKYGYTKNLKCLSVTLLKQIDIYISKLSESEAYSHFEKYGYYLEEEECFALEEVEVPKVLGDIFESVAGAIYLDSGSSIDTVWRIYYPMMKPTIEHLTQHVPMSPIRELLEMYPGTVFSVEHSTEESHIVEITLPNKMTFRGTGPNKKVAKRSAAKRAILFMRNKWTDVA